MHSWHWWDHYETRLQKYVLYTGRPDRYKKFHKKYMSVVSGKKETIDKLEKFLKEMTVITYPHLFKV